MQKSFQRIVIPEMKIRTYVSKKIIADFEALSETLVS